MRTLPARLVVGLLFLFGAVTVGIMLAQARDGALRALAPLLPSIPAEFSAYLTGQAVALFLVITVISLAALAFIDATTIRPLTRLSRHVKELEAETRKDIPSADTLAAAEAYGVVESVRELVAHLEDARLRDASVSRMKSDFIGTAAHQLRTPITGIRWALEALAKSPRIGEEERQLVANATQKASELVEIVKTLLDVSAVEAGKYPYRFAAIAVNELVGEVVRGHLTLAADRGIMLGTSTGELPDARADRERLRWVLSNIIENAIRYTPRGGRVSVTVETLGADRLMIAVSDTGIGILPEDKDNIFERFYRGKNAAEKENEGNGLGLYIARQIVRDHQGDLSFKANPAGQGTTFYFTIPQWRGDAV